MAHLVISDLTSFPELNAAGYKNAGYIVDLASGEIKKLTFCRSHSC